MRLAALIFIIWAGFVIGVSADDCRLDYRPFLLSMADSSDTLAAPVDTTAITREPSVFENKSSGPERGNNGTGPETAGSVNSSGKKIRKPWPTGALFLSAAIPGGGQVYNRKYIKALFYGGTEVYLIKYVNWRWKQMDEHWRNVRNTEDDLVKAQQFSLYEKKRDSRNLHIWLTALVVFVSMFDAYVDAHLADFDQTDKAFDVFIVPEDDLIRLSMVYNF